MSKWPEQLDEHIEDIFKVHFYPFVLKLGQCVNNSISLTFIAGTYVEYTWSIAGGSTVLVHTHTFFSRGTMVAFVSRNGYTRGAQMKHEEYTKLRSPCVCVCVTCGHDTTESQRIPLLHLVSHTTGAIELVAVVAYCYRMVDYLLLNSTAISPNNTSLLHWPLWVKL